MSSTTKSLRALPRVFVPGADPAEDIALPGDELDKLRKVLRLSPGAEIAVLPNDGTIIRCRLHAKHAEPLEVQAPDVEATIRLIVCQALPKGDKSEEIVRACTEIGVAGFVFFPSERSVVRWDEKKSAQRLQRLATIAREAAEVSFRTRLPSVELLSRLSDVLERYPEAQVLSESEAATAHLRPIVGEGAIVVGPEGGWAPREIKLIGERGITLGPRVLRVDHAAAAAAAILLLGNGGEGRTE